MPTLGFSRTVAKCAVLTASTKTEHTEVSAANYFLFKFSKNLKWVYYLNSEFPQKKTF